MKSGLVCLIFLALAPGLRSAPLVLLDPGHGGADAGVSVQDFRESDFTLALAKRMEPLLEARGCAVKLTRDTDQTLSLTARVELANSLQPMALVSLHVNAAFQADAKGPRLFVPAASSKVDEADAPFWEQAAGMHAAASRTLGLCLAKSLGVTGPRSVQTLKLGLFRGLSVPACLVELDFATSPQSLADLKDPAAVDALAARLAGGIADYVVGPIKVEAPLAKP